MTKSGFEPAFTRRAWMAAGGAAAVSTLLPAGAARAAAPAAGRQVPGIYRYRIGEFELTAINDGANMMTLKDGFVRNAAFEDVKASLHDAFLPTDVVAIPFNQLVVNTGRKLVLIDTGTGGQLAPTAGRLVENMEAAGLDAKSVDTVIISHFHSDHILGLRTKEGAAVFPNAEVFVGEAEYAFWMDDGQMSRAPEGQKTTFQNVRKIFGPMAKDLTRYTGEQELVPGIVAHEAFGHTPGHMIFRISSGGDQVLFLSDTTNHPALFVRNPGWHAVFDMDPVMAEATRRRVLDMAAAERLKVQGYHFPFPGHGYIAKEADRYRYVPAGWLPVI
ncbi:MBL fold metallo-hydrolase [Terrihabitans rhizophilus]|uniref:MBL fold metallo-hydrolase n=1 Tax=Terrihabitans rhizophilus TaxID=3092662 RepID=A0ABU4RRV8_9HYPH|nr:MBL fold metallo-hydrolase [Terrihabitans sp. PJ23]MDX6807591.1 MBL fold metallo-hydrolase [Terrihabitans sp. PJ23]